MAQNVSVNQRELYGYFFEYIYKRVIEDINANSERIMPVSQARFLRENLAKKELPEPNERLGYVGVSVYLNAIDNMLVEYGYPEMFRVDPEKLGKNSDAYKKYLDEFSSIRKSGLLPISPYDMRFTNRENIRLTGSKGAYISLHEISTLFDNDLTQLTDKAKTEGLTVYKDSFNNPNKKFKLGPLMSKADYAGVARLMPYMSQKEYMDISKWILSATDELKDKDVYMSEKAMDRSVAILSYLQETGRSYTVHKDKNPGQTEVRITGTNIKVRLTDIKENEHFVGRIYDNGSMVYYSTTKKDSAGRKVLPYKNITSEDVIDQLKFVLGDTVYRKDKNGNFDPETSRKIGQTGMYVGSPNGKKLNSAYLNRTSFVSMVKPYVDENGVVDPTAKVVLRVDMTGRSSSARTFDENSASIYLKDAIKSARENFVEASDLDYLIAYSQEYKEGLENGDSDIDYPVFSGNSYIASLQKKYWDIILKGGDIPKLEFEDDYDPDASYITADGENLKDYMIYKGDFKEQLIQHLNDTLNTSIGSFDRDSENLRFDPVLVASFMTSEFSQFRNNAEIINALKTLDIDADELRGSDFYNSVVKDKMIKFDESTAVKLKDVDSPFAKEILKDVVETIETSGCRTNDDYIFIDENGIISYKAKRYIKQASVEDDNEIISGQIGQVFIPDENGMVKTKFNGSDNYLFVPGYEALIRAQKAGENKTCEERTLLRGYLQNMKDSIRYQLRNDLYDMSPNIGETTSLNNVYRRLYDTRHDLDYFEKSEEEGLSKDWRETLIKTESQRVRYGNDIKDGSTINAEYLARNGLGGDIANDNHFDAFTLTGGRNMAILTREGDGYFDPIMTGGSTNQGITRYLTESAVVNPDGTIKPGDLDDQCSMMKNPDMKFSKFNPFDRQQMVGSNLMQMSAITKDIGIALMPFGGWNQDDGCVISLDMAKEYMVRGKDGEMRPLMRGDKISDLHGNKGTIALVVDRDMDLDLAREKGLEKEVKWFKANPDMDVVMAPYSPASRFNGGTTREFMSNPVGDVYDENGELAKAGGLAKCKFIITQMNVDKKTKIYCEDEVLAGKGRKVSAQLAWSLGAHGCDNVMRELYGTNSTSYANLREYMILMGLDIDEYGNMRDKYTPHEGEVRNIIKLPDLKYIEPADSTKPKRLDMKTMKRDFGLEIGQSGGFMEVPFPVRLPSGELCEQIGEKDGKPLYGLPVLSSYLRCGQEFEDGTSTTHDYTNHYLSIFETMVKYEDSKLRLEEGSLSSSSLKNHQKNVDTAQSRIQNFFDRITGDVNQRIFSNKHNIFRDGIMANRVAQSATAVMTADPRLDLESIAIGPDLARNLKAKDGDYILVWRDPVLRKNGSMYLKVKIDEELLACAIHPALAKPIDGDFDGDSLGLAKLNTLSAHREALDIMTIPAKILDKSSKSYKDVNGKNIPYYKPILNDALDFKASQYVNPDIKNRYEEIVDRMNLQDYNCSTGVLGGSDKDGEFLLNANRKTIKDLSELYRDSYSQNFGTVINSYDNLKDHVRDLVHNCVETGAKGSVGKIQHYLKYLGANYETDMEGNINYDSLRDFGDTLATRDDQINTEYAVAVKSHGTGIAGMFSQRAVSVLRNKSLEELLELTYAPTQSVLQSKHDPDEARHKYEVLMSSARDFWKGRKIEEYTKPNGELDFRAVRDKNGDYVQASQTEWIDIGRHFYNSPHGLNIPINDDNLVKISQDLVDSNGMMMNIEDDAKDLYIAPLDRLAYGGKFEDVMELAKEGKNLYEGKLNERFMPSNIRFNRELLISNPFEKSVKTFVKSDVRKTLESGPKDLTLSQIANKMINERVSTIQAEDDLPELGSSIGNTDANIEVENEDSSYDFEL